MDENTARDSAALAGLLYILGRVDSAFAKEVPFSPPMMDELASRASRLALGAELTEFPVTTRLQSVFSILTVKEQPAPSKGFRYLSLAPLSLQIESRKDAPIFPIEAMNGGDVGAQIKNQYKAVQEGMVVLNKAHTGGEDLPTYLESLMFLLQRELWCVPSGVAGASLYDHARATAALSACLVDRASDQSVATLIGGDISGIQNFIYTITSRGAASSLRGRSLYLQLMTDAISRYILRKLNLPIANLLFAGGGHFFILAHPGVDLQTIQKEVSRILLALHGGDLYLALEGVSLEEKEFVGKALTEKWSELSGKLREAKLHKFSELGDSLHALVFAPRRDQGNAEKECAVCGREHPGTKPVKNRMVCPQCHSYENLGRDLREAKILRIGEVDEVDLTDADLPARVDDALAYFGMQASLYTTPRQMMDDQKTLQNVHRSVVYALTDDVLSELQPDARTAIGRRFLVNVTPIVRTQKEIDALRETGMKEEELPGMGDVKPFEALELESRGIERLGILRMDVDYMGEIISKGLEDRANLARLANLSFMINLFFEGWAAEVARKYNRKGGAETDSVYSIYSGGDDLFFVGAWDRMPELALEICNDLKRFAGEHPGIHASAGIALVSGKYPLYQAAEDAHNALERSKNHEGKNSITFLEQTQPWKQFAGEIEPQAKRLMSLVEKDFVPRSVVQRLQQFQLQFQEKQEEARSRGEAETSKGEEQVVWGPWNWRAVYYLTKARSRAKEEARKELMDIRDKLGNEEFRAIEWIGLMARWVDLLTGS